MDEDLGKKNEQRLVVGEAFPPSLEPPWNGRRNTVAGIVVPIALVVTAGAAVGIHFVVTSGDRMTETYPLAANTANGSALDPSSLEHLSVAAGSNDHSSSSGVEGSGRASTWILNGQDGAVAEAPATTSPRPAAAKTKTDPEPANTSGVEATTSEDTAKGTVIHRGKLGEGNTITHRLGKHGLSARQIGEVVQALKGRYDFRSSRPNHQYELELRRDTGEVARFRYEAGRTQIFEVTRRGAELRGRRVPVKTQSRYIRVGRYVRGSLARTIEKAGLKRQVFKAFMRTFGRDMSFQSEQQESDTFRVIVEEERLDGDFIGYKAVWAIEYTGKSTGRRRAYYYQPDEKRGHYYDEKALSFDRTKLRTPCSYTHISSSFNLRRLHPVLKRRVPHRGVDMAAPRGTPVWATAKGTTTFVGRKGANGNLVVIRHEGGFESAYAHLQKFARGLKRGQEVRQGQLIGYVGSTGRSTGPHLHFGLRIKGRFVDPMKYRSGPGRPIDRSQRGKFLRHASKLQRELARIKITKQR